MKKIVIFFLLLTITFSLSGCYDARGIEELAYVIAIGIDTSDNDEIVLSLQFATSGDSSSGESSESSSQSKETNLTSIKCKTIDSGIALINNHISKKISLSHCQVITISEELSKKGISQYMETLINNVELRSDCSIIVTKCKAKDYLDKVEPALENLTARFYQSSLNSAEYTGYTVDITLSQFYSKMKDSYCEAYAILGNTNSEENIEKNYELNANITAGDSPISDKDVIDNLGIAVFKDDKLVGQLTGLESLCHVISNNELKQCTLSIPSPFEGNKFVDISLYNQKKPSCTVTIYDETPVISIEVFLEGNALSLDNSVSYDSQDSLNKLNAATSKYLEDKIQSYLYKTSKEYNSDICGFGKYAVNNYFTLDEWYKVNWLQNYKNSIFKVKVNANIKSGNIFSKP